LIHRPEYFPNVDAFRASHFPSATVQPPYLKYFLLALLCFLFSFIQDADIDIFRHLAGWLSRRHYFRIPVPFIISSFIFNIFFASSSPSSLHYEGQEKRRSRHYATPLRCPSFLAGFRHEHVVYYYYIADIDATSCHYI